MKSIRRIQSVLARLHRDQRGAEGLEKLLIIAAVALPLLAILIFFGSEIRDTLSDWWTEVRGESDDFREDNPF